MNLLKIVKKNTTDLLKFLLSFQRKFFLIFKENLKIIPNLLNLRIGDIINATEKYIMDPADREQMVAELNLEITRTNKLLQEKVDEMENKKDLFKTSFFNLNQRYPTEEELEKNIKFIEDEGTDNEPSDNDEDNMSNSSKISGKYLEKSIEI